MAITSKQRAQLRGMAMSIDTIIQIGKGGITESVVDSVSAALKARELVKGKVLENSMLTAREACDELCEKCQGRGRTGHRHEVRALQAQRERAEDSAGKG